MNTDSLLVIASYPQKGQVHGQKTVGVASYTKNTLFAIYNSAPHEKKPIIKVLAEKLEKNEDTTYKDGGIAVTRLWQRNHLGTFFTLLKEIFIKHNDTKHILIELELAMFGGKLLLIPLPFFVLFLRLLGKNVTIAVHQVITDIKDLSGHIYTYDNHITISLLNFSIQVFYKLLLQFATKVIVFETALQERLSKFGAKKKVVVIPHGVEQFSSSHTQNQVRKILDIPKDNFVLLYFGFLAWYKGADWLIKTFSKIPKKDRSKISLVIAGGPNPNHINNLSYRSYITVLEQACKKNGIILTGFVPEKNISLYFTACDIVIFPYRTYMSASGPLSIAYSFGKPFLVSNRMSDIFRESDLESLLKQHEIFPEDLIFSLENRNFEKKIISIKNDFLFLKKATNLSKHLGKLRNFDTIGKMYYKVCFL